MDHRYTREAHNTALQEHKALLRAYNLRPADIPLVQYRLQRYFRSPDTHASDKPIIAAMLRALNMVADEDTDDGVFPAAEDARAGSKGMTSIVNLRFDHLPKSLLAKELPPYHEGHSLQRYFSSILYAFTHGSLVDAFELGRERREAGRQLGRPAGGGEGGPW